MKNVRILIADDHDVVRMGIRMLIEKEPGMKVCAEAVNGRQAVALAEKFHPDVAVLDLTMPELNGLEAARQIKGKLPDVEVVMLSAYENDDLVHQVFEVGARSYIRKTEAANYLIPAVRSAHAHQPFLTSRMDKALFARLMEAKSGKPEEELLTKREREIVQLIAEGASNKEVAKRLRISARTAETHRAHILQKLNLHTVADLVRYAIRNNITQV